MFIRLLVLLAIAALSYKWITGRWPWEPKVSTRQQAIFRARRLLGLEAGASREEILAAHKRLVAMVHPDKGGSNEQVHEANAARDLLFDELPGHVGDNQERR
jgi:DnaJ family protein C protein 19